MRGKVLLARADGVRLVLTGFFDRRHDDAAASAQPLNGDTNAAFFPGSIIATKPHHVTNELKGSVVPTRSEHRGVSLRGDFDVGEAGTLTSLTGYTFVDSVMTSDIDSASSPNCPIRLALFGKNLTGRRFVTGTLLAAPIDGVEYTPPRQIGVSRHSMACSW